jgi:hypothetical protein
MAECSFIHYRLQDWGVVMLTLDDPLNSRNQAAGFQSIRGE